MKNLPVALAQSLDRLDDAVDGTAALAALMFSEHALDDVHRRQIATLLRVLTRAQCQDEPPADARLVLSADQWRLSFEALADLMDPATVLDTEGRSMVYTLLLTLSDLQRHALDQYTQAVRAHWPEGAAQAKPKPRGNQGDLAA